MTRPRRFTFAFVTSVSGTCMLSKLYFQDSCVIFSWVKSLGRYLLSDAYIRPPLFSCFESAPVLLDSSTTPC